MLLAIDVSNTSIVLSVLNEKLVDGWRLATVRTGATAMGSGSGRASCSSTPGSRRRITDVVMASVVPPLSGTIVEMASEHFGSHRS
jgi:pantothenate kinase type III